MSARAPSLRTTAGVSRRNDDDDEDKLGGGRWARAVCIGVRLTRLVRGFAWRGGKEWTVEGALWEKAAAWVEERREREEEEARRSRVRCADPVEVDENEAIEEDSEDDKSAPEEVREGASQYLRYSET